ncbi:MAG: branched-chain amino acid ABC transporter permease, partial [Actinomycetota bacterium]|nr:branched-chain amino acid ABC transporter permease [Actinomycetota bacterium]
MSLSYLLEQTLNGITLGGLYAHVALGYTLVYGILL